ncbi:Major facilitator superfamily domain-containing protein 12 [Eufriesea mexicana]|nr:Major facilitator superfamily domain-containing protein 12 [Eufriesea mexicana]
MENEQITEDYSEVIQRLSFSLKLSYGIGHVLNDICASMWFTYLLVFFHLVLGFNSISAGIILLIGQIADAFATPFVGFHSDKNDDFWLCRYGTLCVLFAFPFIFSHCVGCETAHEWAQLIYYAAFVIIFQFGWAAIQISHLSLIPELTPVEHERTELVAISFSVLSNVFVYCITWAVLHIANTKDFNSQIGPDDAKKFQTVVFIGIGLGTITSILFHIFVKEKFTNNSNGKINFIIVYSMIIFIYLNIYFIVSILERLNTKLGRKISYCFGVVLGVCACIWIRFGNDLTYVKYQIYPVSLILGSAGSIMLVTSLGIIADFIGQNIDNSAITYGIMSFTDKLCNGLTVMLIQYFTLFYSFRSSWIHYKNYYRDVLVYICAISAIFSLLMILCTKSFHHNTDVYLYLTELLKHLNTNEEPLSKRLKLAENAFCAINVPIIHKDDLILQWLCSVHSMDPNVWNSLKNCLKIQYLNIKNNNLKTIFIHDILYPLCVIIDLNCNDNTNRLGSIAHKCIQQLIFGRKHIQSTELLRNEDITHFNNLLSILTENAKIKDFDKKSILKHRYLMISILDASIYLRQEEKLISAILITLKDSLYHISTLENDMFFSNEFKKRLTEAVNNITNSQIVFILTTLTYHLKTDCLEILQSTNTSTNNLMLQTIVELLITVLSGICIFEYSGSSPSYKKFITSFDDLKNVLLLLIDKTLYLNRNEEINKLILQQTKMLQNRLNKSMMLKNLIGDLEHYWSVILKCDTEVISSLSNKQVSKLTHLLLTDMISNVDNFNEWVKVLHKNDLQENKRLIIFLLTCIFTQIGHLATEGVTNSISKYFNAELLFEVEIVKCEKINNILMSIKEELLINLLEKSNLDVFQYIDPFLLLQLLPQNKTFQKNDQNKIGNELLQDGLQLVVVILRNKKLFQITNLTIRAIWSTLLKYPYVEALSLLLESSEPNEFSEFLEELHNRLVKALLNAHESDLENICIIWNVILKTSMSSDRNRLRITAINNLIQTMQTINILEKFWPNVLKLIQNIFATKHLYLPGFVIDMSIILGLKSLKEDKILICSDTLAFCSVLLKVRTNLIRDRIPSLLIMYRQILNILVYKSKFVINKFEEQRFKCLALDIERFTSSLIKFKKDMIRISPYLVAYLLKLFSEISVPNFIKKEKDPSLVNLQDAPRQHFSYRAFPGSLDPTRTVCGRTRVQVSNEGKLPPAYSLY